jgi:hypothetical protein
MLTRWGATPEEWHHFSKTLGLTTELLPVVSNPHAIISPRSAITTLGKTPSLYNSARQVIGIPGWTEHITTEEEIARWSAEPDYGICVQTRIVRALDVDVTDPETADVILALCKRSIPGPFPIRRRPNSCKFLIPFRLPGDLGKQTMKTIGGIIEFLANGQQFVACGTHPSGVRYEWVPGLPESLR